MPELPEVETIRRDLVKSVLHKKFLQIKVCDPFVIKGSPESFTQGLVKQSITSIERRGKALIFHLSNRHYLVIQLMMTGQLVVGSKPTVHTRIIFQLNDKSVLHYNDQRRFGKLQVVKGLKEVKHLSILGPEPLENHFNADYIYQSTRHLQRPIKNLLLDHTFVAGIGNIYACEILFRCHIDPRKPVGRISRQRAQDLHTQTIEVLKEAIKHRGSSMRNYLDASGQKGGFKARIRVYAREGQACLNCQTPIVKIVQAGRSTFFCPQCQKSC